MADVARLNAPVTPAAEPTPAAGIVATETANGGVVVRRDDTATADNKGETLILGKFKDQEALVKAYTELEKKLGAGKPVETPAAAATAATPVDAAAAAAKGIDLKALSAEYIAGGNKLSDASMAALTAAGITQEQVSAYIAGQQAVADKISTDLAAVVGGQDKLTATLEWAKTNATDEQRAAFDAALDSGNIPLLKLALAQINTAYTAAVGTDPKLVQAEQAPLVTGPKPFASQQEMMNAMKDPRYRKGDRAYIKSVEARVGVSNLFGRQS
jgi:hypothetical protein